MLIHSAARHHQVAYVTRDLDRAIEALRDVYGIARFFVLPAMPPGGPELRIGLANVGGVEIEVIQPIANAPIYSDPLENSESLLLFHHTASRIEGSLSVWEAYRAQLDESAHPVVFEGAVGDFLRFAYTDERPRLGHYLEHLWMSQAHVDELYAAIPRFP